MSVVARFLRRRGCLAELGCKVSVYESSCCRECPNVPGAWCLVQDTEQTTYGSISGVGIEARFVSEAGHEGDGRIAAKILRS